MVKNVVWPNDFDEGQKLRVILAKTQGYKAVPEYNWCKHHKSGWVWSLINPYGTDTHICAESEESAYALGTNFMASQITHYSQILNDDLKVSFQWYILGERYFQLILSNPHAMGIGDTPREAFAECFKAILNVIK